MEKQVQPILRFPEFVGNWKNYSFKDIFSFTTGKNIKQKEASPSFDTPCVRYGELYYMYKEVISKVINYTNLDASDLKFSDGDEIILPSAGEDPMDIGSASALTLKNVAIGRTINILKPKNDGVYSPIFASYYINKMLKVKISTLAKGVSISNVYNSDLQTLFLKLPSLPEQKKIADYLSTIDEKLSLLEEKKTELSRYKKAMMQKLFSQEIRFKDENGNDFSDWEEKRLGEVLIEKNEKSNINNQYEILSSAVNGIYLQKDYFTRDIASKNNIGYKILKINQLVFSPQNIWMGNLNVNTKFKIGLVSPSYKIFDFNKVSIEYFKYFLKTPKMVKEYLISSEQGASVVRRNLNLELFKLIKLLIPSLHEQQKIADFLSTIDESIDKVSEQIKETKRFKKSMLQQMFV